MLNAIAADLPLREVLGGVPVPVRPEQIAVNPDYEPSVLIQQAAGISVALGGEIQEHPNYDSTISGLIALTRASVGRCEGAIDEAAEGDELIRLASRTIPFLDAAHLGGVWTTPRWITCSSQPEVAKDLLALFDAQSQRNFGQAYSRAVALLDGRAKKLSPLAQDWILRAAMVAAIADRKFEDVARLELTEGKTIQMQSGSVQQRVYLRKFAEAQSHK
jgi:hypothetical protein